jgi:hypothetical protein
MQPLDKTQVFAKPYKTWQDNLTATNTNHPAYNSSKGEFYYDIIANLIWVQKGLCAYTEYRLQAFEKCAEKFWDNGKFQKFDFAGELDHYDPTLKANQSWLWDNFFLIDADINSKKVKGNKQPNGILKPDKADFNPADFLEYEIATHLFIPSRLLQPEEQYRVLHDIDTLGLNWQPIKERREEYLNEFLLDVKYKKITFVDAMNKLTQFFTAFRLCREYLES